MKPAVQTKAGDEKKIQDVTQSGPDFDLINKCRRELDETLRAASITRMEFADVCVLRQPGVRLDPKFGPYIAQKLADFTVDDPYEVCFAALFLMDRGDGIAWLNQAYNVLKCAAELLPWTNMHNEYMDVSSS